MRWTGVTACAVLAVVELVNGIGRHSTGSPSRTGRWLPCSPASLVCCYVAVGFDGSGSWSAWLAAVGLATGIVYLTDGFTQGVGPAWAAAGLFVVVAVLLCRRGRKQSAARTEDGQLS